MRLVKLVVAGVAVGAVGGYVGALLRPRSVHRNLAADLALETGVFDAALDPGPLPEQHDDAASSEFAAVRDTVEARR